MPGSSLRRVLFWCLVGLLGLGALPSEPAELPSPAAVKIDFTLHIRPILRDRCQQCHGLEQQLGGLRLDTPEAALEGGNSGPVILPGKSAQSRLIRLVAGLEESLVMPMGSERLTEEEIGLLRAWIDQGAPGPETAVASVSEAVDQDSATDSPRPASSHWAFISPERPSEPRVREQAWVRNPVDAFVLAKLEANGISPSPQVQRTTLIRRLSLDLIGLPPTPSQVHEFLRDNRPDAYERLVDRLLASPHYGEKWARHWLDLGRYGDSDGYENDGPRPHAWRWRHWVIEALNRNLPFDQFTIEQLAGDLLPGATVEQRVATGFNRNTLTNREGGMNLELRRTEQVMDRTETLGTVWLGLTVGCARCHDHKYDPISHKDYYQLYAFFNTTREVNIEAPLPGEMGPYLLRKPEYDQKRQELLKEHKMFELYSEWERKMLEVDSALQSGQEELADKVPDEWKLGYDHIGFDVDNDREGGYPYLRTPPAERTQKLQDLLMDHFAKWGMLPYKDKKEQLAEVRKKLGELRREYPPLSEAQTITQNPDPPKTHLLLRGDYRRLGIETPPDVLSILPPLPESEGQPSRLALARWVVSRDNPLTARVTVNRMWQAFFGRGLVKTSEDFGTRGEAPTHPSLLDWLAVEFMDNGWNVKKMHKLIVTSATYRQSSGIREDLQQLDPDNKLVAHQQRLRLPAELIRDATLATSGLLSPNIGGKSVYPPQHPAIQQRDAWNTWEESQGADRYRRGLYTFFQRTDPYPQLVNFDAPDSLSACSQRDRSTTPLQALNLLNDPVFFEAARGLAARVLREQPGRSPSDRIDYAFRLCMARGPHPAEKERLLQYYRVEKEASEGNDEQVLSYFPARGVEGVEPSEAAVWVGLSRALLNLDEFITRE